MTNLTYVWGDGTVKLWSGAATPTAVHLAQTINIAPVKGILNQQTVNGLYYNAITGQRVDVSINFLFTQDMYWWRLFDGATAVNMQIDHNHARGSAGWFFWSGIIDSIPQAGGEGGAYSMTMNYHSNIWSAYGQ